MQTTTLVIENLDHLPVEDQQAVRATFEFMQGTKPTSFKTLHEEIGRWAARRGWFLYRGGNHLALHRRSGDPKRVVFVTNDGNAG